MSKRRSDSPWCSLARAHRAIAIEESNNWLGAKFNSRLSAENFAADINASIGRQPKVSVSPLNSTKYWAQLRWKEKRR